MSLVQRVVLAKHYKMIVHLNTGTVEDFQSYRVSNQAHVISFFQVGFLLRSSYPNNCTSKRTVLLSDFLPNQVQWSKLAYKAFGSFSLRFAMEVEIPSLQLFPQSLSAKGKDAFAE